MEPLYDAAKLVTFAKKILAKAGLPKLMARDVAEVLVEGDLLGKHTHGLALLPQYLEHIESGTMGRAGAPKVLKKKGAALLLDADYLPGPWVIRGAIKWAIPRAKRYGAATVSIRRCHHIAALQAYLPAVTQQGLVALLMCSDPANATVAPPGGVQAVCSPNPVAAGFPTEGDPVLIDTTTSLATNAQVARLYKQKKMFPVACLQTVMGDATDDPSVLYREPRGTILPLGGLEFGHKGFAFSIIVEALTSALAGYGRRDNPNRWGASVFLQVIDPELFGGVAAFKREHDFYAQTVRKSARKPAGAAIRLPGEAALARRYEQLTSGVELHPEITESMAKWTGKLGVEFPRPMQPPIQERV